MLIATHDGTFHADETMACAIISYIHKDCRVIRSRRPEDFAKADIVIDVSGINDETHFDHHSPDFKEARPDGIRYATAGLMWLKFGREFLRLAAASLPFTPNEEIYTRAWERIDREIMVDIDLNDNGDWSAYIEKLAAPQTPGERRVMQKISEFIESIPGIPYLVAMSNTPLQDKNAQEQCFLNTARSLRMLLHNCAINALHTEYSISRVISAYTGGQLLILHERLPWSQAVLDHPEAFTSCLLAVYPDRNQRWRVQSLPLSKAERFVNRLSAPVAWRGLNGADLDAATGLEHTSFVHRSGFTGGAEDYESCLKLAEKWLKLGQAESGRS